MTSNTIFVRPSINTIWVPTLNLKSPSARGDRSRSRSYGNCWRSSPGDKLPRVLICFCSPGGSRLFWPGREATFFDYRYCRVYRFAFCHNPRTQLLFVHFRLRPRYYRRWIEDTNGTHIYRWQPLLITPWKKFSSAYSYGLIAVEVFHIWPLC